MAGGRQLGQKGTVRISLSGIGGSDCLWVLARRLGERGEDASDVNLSSGLGVSQNLIGFREEAIDQTHTELTGPHIWVLARAPGLTLQPQLPPLTIVRITPALPPYMDILRIT